MVHIYVHHGESLSQSLDVYVGDNVEHIGNHESDYLSVEVLKKFVCKKMGYLNVEKFAYKFCHNETMRFTFLANDDDFRKLLDTVVQKK